MITVFALILTAAISWTLGHRTARVQIIPIGTTIADDETALSAADEQLLGEWSAHLDQLLDTYDPDTTKDETP